MMPGFQMSLCSMTGFWSLQDPQAKDRIIDLLREAKEGTFTGEHARTLKTIVTASGGLARAAADMEMYAERALQAVETLPDHGVSAVFRELLQTKCKVSAAG